MNKYLTLALVLISFSIFSQELDKAYLESLPDEIRDDVLQKIEDREESDQTIYRRESSMVSKPDLQSNRFGDNIFNMMQSSFMPINEPNADSSYVVDFGDILEVQLTGQKNSIDKLDIKRDGSINIPEIGKIFVSGLSLNTVDDVIRAKITSSYIGVEVYVTLVSVRDIQVLIAGNAYSPGIYTLNGNSNLLHALSMAGGVDKKGSYRHIDLIRDDKVINTIDLYDFFISGKSGFGTKLRSGDSILVRPSKKMVSLSGAVNRPATYELKKDEGFIDLLNFGNGISDNADYNGIRIERLEGKNVTLLKVPDIDSIASMPVISSDTLYIRPFIRKTISISGAVNSPGTYQISSNDSLSSLIIKADGYKENAYPFGGILNNIDALEKNQLSVDILYNSFVKQLINKSSTLFQSENLPFILNQLKTTNVNGRIIAEFDLDVIEANPELDTALSDGDDIFIPSLTQQVYVFGELNNPGAVRYKPSQSIDEYLLQAGGKLISADSKNIFVAHPNGEITLLNTNNLFLRKKGEILIYPGSVIYVPQLVKSADASVIASIWAPIVSSMATSITALSILNKN
jgi:protein involved in polysaccharide export with SLBB domain